MLGPLRQPIRPGEPALAPTQYRRIRSPPLSAPILFVSQHRPPGELFESSMAVAPVPSASLPRSQFPQCPQQMLNGRHAVAVATVFDPFRRAPLPGGLDAGSRTSLIRTSRGLS